MERPRVSVQGRNVTGCAKLKWHAAARAVSLSFICRQNFTRWTPLCRHTWRLQIVWRPAASWIAPSAVRWIRRLQLLHEGQRCAEPLILDDRAGRHRLDLVEYPERQGDTVVPDSEAPVRVIHHLDCFAGEPAREGRRVQQKHHPVITQREIAGELALLAPRQDLIKIVGLAQGAV